MFIRPWQKLFCQGLFYFPFYFFPFFCWYFFKYSICSLSSICLSMSLLFLLLPNITRYKHPVINKKIKTEPIMKMFLSINISPFLLLLVCLLGIPTSSAQPRYDMQNICRETLNRGVVAIKSNGKVAISWRLLKADNHERHNRLIRFAMQRGFSYSIAEQCVASIEED